MNYKQEIEKLEKSIEFNKEKIALNEKYGISKYDMQTSKLEDEIKENQTLINLFKKFEALPSTILDVPSKTIHFYIDYGADNTIELYPGFKDDICGKLYLYVCDSYSEWWIQLKKFIEASFYNVTDIPRLLIKVESNYWVSSLEKRCEYFYDNVLQFINFLNDNAVGKTVLNSIDTYYLNLIEVAKENE